jgi:hypothetical protein
VDAQKNDMIRSFRDLLTTVQITARIVCSRESTYSRDDDEQEELQESRTIHLKKHESIPFSCQVYLGGGTRTSEALGAGCSVVWGTGGS